MHRNLALRALAFSLPVLALAASRGRAQSHAFDHPSGMTHWYECVSVAGGIRWSEARAAAAAAGGYLATSSSAEENGFLFALIDKPEFWTKTSSGEWRGPWIGGVKLQSDWIWSETEPMSFRTWSVQQPDETRPASRLHFGGTTSGRSATWGDTAESDLLPGYIIEYSGATAPRTVGLKRREPGSFDGYTMIYPSGGKTTYLLDPRGRPVHSWTSELSPMVAYLEPNGHLLRSGAIKNPKFPGGGVSGVVEEFDWRGKRRWRFELETDDESLHHDLARLPNGNILMMVWERISGPEAIAAGRDPAILSSNELWPEKIIEVEPRRRGGKIVWEWRAWDHLVQDFDKTKPNYASVRDHPERIDLNYQTRPDADWLHANAIHYNAKLDQIVLSVRHFNEIWIIDHSTTTAEAAGRVGGRSGKGGDLLYRWGNLAAYRAGTEFDAKLEYQHDAHWIADGLPGAGNILIFSNGWKRPWSSIEEITPPAIDARGNYARTSANTWGPAFATWRYEDKDPGAFYSSFISGCQRLPNGNTLICSGAEGRIFEVTAQGATVWEYENPVVSEPALQHGDVPQNNFIFRAPRYAPNYPGLAHRRLEAGPPVERYREALLIDGSTAPHRATLGQRVELTLRTSAARKPAHYYQLVTSASAGTIPVGYRDVRLGWDAMAAASTSGTLPMVFEQYFGRLDKTGSGRAAIEIPRLPVLLGTTLRTAFVVLDADASRIGTISNTVKLELEQS